MVTFGHVYVNACGLDAAEIINEVSQAHKQQTKQQQQPKSAPGTWTKVTHPSKKPRLDNGKSRDNLAPAIELESGLKQFTLSQQGNRTFTRSHKVTRYCMGKKICCHCYQEGHSPNYCSNGMVKADPPGFDPNFKPTRPKPGKYRK
jgi:hypothetical protein